MGLMLALRVPLYLDLDSKLKAGTTLTGRNALAASSANRNTGLQQYCPELS